MPRIGFDTERKVKLRVMTKEEEDAIHWASLNILSKTGMKIYSKSALQTLKDNGVDVDFSTKLAKIPEHLVAEGLKRFPKAFDLCGRIKDNDVKLDGRHVYFSTDATGVATYDLETGEKRGSTKDDVNKAAIMSDFLPGVAVFNPCVTPLEVPPHTHTLHELDAGLNNTEKHVMVEAVFIGAEAEVEIKMASLVTGGEKELKRRPIISSIMCCIFPLTLDGGAMDASMVFARAGVPVHLMSMPQAGTSGPATLAACLAINNAEILGANTVLQLASPGAPVLYSTVGSPMDLRTGGYGGGGRPETALLNAGGVQLAKRYGMPSSPGSMGSMAKMIGPQIGHEHTLVPLTMALSGGDLLNGLGMLEGSKVLSFEQLMIDHEIATAVLRLISGFSVTDETLSLEMIDRVGPRGNFLQEPHTFKHMREIWDPSLSDLRPYDVWKKSGAETMEQVARRKAKDILAKHKPAQLDQGISKQLSAIISEVEKKPFQIGTTENW
jgi:trimethylamine--corrinoid protein Co-methyltransferase